MFDNQVVTKKRRMSSDLIINAPGLRLHRLFPDNECPVAVFYMQRGLSQYPGYFCHQFSVTCSAEFSSKRVWISSAIWLTILYSCRFLRHFSGMAFSPFNTPIIWPAMLRLLPDGWFPARAVPIGACGIPLHALCRDAWQAPARF